MIGMYTFETHSGVDTDAQELSYGDGNSMTLNTLHNVDAAFGEFWQWFMDSPYKDNTIVIVTADHAHYNDQALLSLVGDAPDYRSCFINRIPLLIYDPVHELPARYDADDRTSLDLTPTVLHLLDVHDVRNSFLGTSIFTNQQAGAPLHVAALGLDFYGIKNHVVYKDKQVSAADRDFFEGQKEHIRAFYANEKRNKVFQP